LTGDSTTRRLDLDVKRVARFGHLERLKHGELQGVVLLLNNWLSLPAPGAPADIFVSSLVSGRQLM
jgi:hypothetical protein